MRTPATASDAYALTPLSRLLVTGESASLSPFVLAMLHPIIVAPSMSLSSWFRTDDPAAPVPFASAHGCEFWAMATRNREFSAAFNAGMACDASFAMGMLVRDHGDLFRGLRSLVDVGGGSGGAAKAIAAAFPHIKCSVLELPHVVAEVEAVDGEVEFVAGDMFVHVPPADAVLLKWILHGWNDEDCVKILRRCKEAIPTKERGGRVIVMDLVVGSSSDAAAKEKQFLWDVMMMAVAGSPEREEHEWLKIFVEAGFSGYKILPILGLRSVIEVYP